MEIEMEGGDNVETSVRRSGAGNQTIEIDGIDIDEMFEEECLQQKEEVYLDGNDMVEDGLYGLD